MLWFQHELIPRAQELEAAVHAMQSDADRSMAEAHGHRRELEEELVRSTNHVLALQAQLSELLQGLSSAPDLQKQTQSEHSQGFGQFITPHNSGEK